MNFSLLPMHRQYKPNWLTIVPLPCELPIFPSQKLERRWNGTNTLPSERGLNACVPELTNSQFCDCSELKAKRPKSSFCVDYDSIGVIKFFYLLVPDSWHPWYSSRLNKEFLCCKCLQNSFYSFSLYFTLLYGLNGG